MELLTLPFGELLSSAIINVYVDLLVYHSLKRPEGILSVLANVGLLQANHDSTYYD